MSEGQVPNTSYFRNLEGPFCGASQPSTASSTLTLCYIFPTKSSDSFQKVNVGRLELLQVRMAYRKCSHNVSCYSVKTTIIDSFCHLLL